MQFLDLLYDNKYSRKGLWFSHGNSEEIFITVPERSLIGISVMKMANFFKKQEGVETRQILNFEFRCKTIDDDSTIGVLELLCYDYLSKHRGSEIKLSFPKLDHRIFGYQYLLYSLFSLRSPFQGKEVLDHPFNLTFENYCSKFDKKLTIERTYLRQAFFRPVTSEAASASFETITNFLQISGADKNWIDKLGEAISEVIDNALSHTTGDCVGSFKIITGVQDTETKEDLLVLDASIINVSPETIDSTLSKAVETFSSYQLDNKKQMVSEAKDRHSAFFDNKYTKDSFYLISAFQDCVSSRPLGSQGGGGKGLTRLLETLQKDAYYDNCYALSGKNVVWFKKGHITQNNDGTIGFNEANNYLNMPPEKPYFNDLDFFFHGSIFNLLFVLKRQNKNEN